MTPKLTPAQSEDCGSDAAELLASLREYQGDGWLATKWWHERDILLSRVALALERLVRVERACSVHRVEFDSHTRRLRVQIEVGESSLLAAKVPEAMAHALVRGIESEIIRKMRELQTKFAQGEEGKP